MSNKVHKRIKFRKPLLLTPLLYIAINSCVQEGVNDPIVHVLASEDPRIEAVMRNLQVHEVQILYTEINRKGDSVTFTDHVFQVDGDSYFYPASSVKFPIAVLALEYLSSVEQMDRNTRFYIEGDSVETTLTEEVIKIFAVSDNAANNRLVELMGQDHINQRLSALGVAPVRISHRLSAPDADNVTTVPIILYLNDSTTTTLPSSTNTPPENLHLRGVLKGIGYIAEDSLISEPFDFSLKNHYPLTSQHAVLKRVIFPEAFPDAKRFGLDPDSHDFLLSSMKILPHQAGYDRTEYYDSYGKFFLFGDSEEPIPDHIEIYNKVGYAYGTLTDCAYIKDLKNGIEFLLTATILVNKDGVFNDNVYEYEDIGIPFLAALGEGLYTLELNKKQKP